MILAEYLKNVIQHYRVITIAEYVKKNTIKI